MREKTALYLRLSKEDGDKEESNSIDSQRRLLLDYLNRKPELEFYLKNAGFELVDNLDCMTLGKTGYDSWTSYFVAKAV